MGHVTDDTTYELTTAGRRALAEARVADAFATTPGWPGVGDPTLVDHLAGVAVAAYEAR